MPSNNNSQPLISVVIPVFKSANKLPVTLDSLFAQGDLSLWEAIVRDGSPDSSVGRQVVEQFLVKNPTANIQFIDGPDKGVYDAMNQGIEASAGKFLYFAGSGDTVLDGVFDKISGELQESLRKNKFCVVYGSWEHSDAKQLKGHEYTWMDFARKRNINHQAMFFSRGIFDRLGLYDIKYPIRADNILNMRIWADSGIDRKFVPIAINHFEGGGLSDTKVDKAFYDDFDRINRECFGLKGAILGKMVDIKVALSSKK